MLLSPLISASILIGPINILESIMCMSACFHRQAVSDCVLRKHGIYHVQTVNSYHVRRERPS